MSSVFLNVFRFTRGLLRSAKHKAMVQERALQFSLHELTLPSVISTVSSMELGKFALSRKQQHELKTALESK